MAYWAGVGEVAATAAARRPYFAVVAREIVAASVIDGAEAAAAALPRVGHGLGEAAELELAQRAARLCAAQHGSHALQALVRHGARAHLQAAHQQQQQRDVGADGVLERRPMEAAEQAER